MRRQRGGGCDGSDRGRGGVAGWCGVMGWQSDGSYLTPEGERLTTELAKAAYLRTVQDWIIRPQLRTVPNVADVAAIGGYLKQYHVLPNPRALQGYGLTLQDVIGALERNNRSLGAGTSQRGRGHFAQNTSHTVRIKLSRTAKNIRNPAKYFL